MAHRRTGLDSILNRREPSTREKFWSTPLTFMAKLMYSLLEPQVPAPNDESGIRVVCISDTHNTQPTLPDGDLLLHAGDLTQSGSREELDKQIEWLDSQPHKFKVVIAGNHDLCLDPSTATQTPGTVNWRSIIYLEDSSTILRFRGGRALCIYGSPWTPQHGNWAFQYRVGADRWSGTIPENTDILLTHGPPKHHLDLGHLGCSSLLSEVRQKAPLLHVFGHIHAGYGRRNVIWDKFESAYEKAVGKDASWFDFWKMLFCVIPRMRSQTEGARKGTIMVNAAAIGGFRDQEQREPITVII